MRLPHIPLMLLWEITQISTLLRQSHVFLCTFLRLFFHTECGGSASGLYPGAAFLILHSLPPRTVPPGPLQALILRPSLSFSPHAGFHICLAHHTVPSPLLRHRLEYSFRLVPLSTFHSAVLLHCYIPTF